MKRAGSWAGLGSRKREVWVPMLVALAACGGPERAHDGERLEQAAVAPIDSSAAGSELEEPLLDVWAERLRHVEEHAQIGVLDGPAEKQFGEITAVAAANGRVLVVDRIMEAVRVYDTTLAYVGSLAPPGGGPLEMRSLRGAAWGENGEIAIADGFGMKVFGLDSDGAIRLLAHPRLRAGPDGICATAGRVFVRVLSPVLDKLIESVRMDGSDEIVFGTPLPAPDPHTRATLSRGRIVCTRNPERVILTFAYDPLVVAYDANGSQVWRSEIRPFRRSDWDTLTVRGSQAIARNAGTPADYVFSAAALDDGVVAIQVFRADPPGRMKGFSTGRFDTYVISAQTGRGRLVDARLGTILAADKGGYWERRSVGNVPVLMRTRYVEPNSDPNDRREQLSRDSSK